MVRGELYVADDPELAAEPRARRELLERYNATGHDEQPSATGCCASCWAASARA